MLEQADVLDYDTDGNTAEVTRSFYHRNALGSVMAITDLNQATVVSYRYDPYGKVTITRNGQTQSTDPLGQHWTFTGRFLDEESGLYYYRARYYDPVLGRFLQRDPLGYAEGACLFEYAGSSPVVWGDPSGEAWGAEPQEAMVFGGGEDGSGASGGWASRSEGVSNEGDEGNSTAGFPIPPEIEQLPENASHLWWWATEVPHTAWTALDWGCAIGATVVWGYVSFKVGEALGELIADEVWEDDDEEDKEGDQAEHNQWCGPAFDELRSLEGHA